MLHLDISRRAPVGLFAAADSTVVVAALMPCLRAPPASLQRLLLPSMLNGRRGCCAARLLLVAIPSESCPVVMRAALQEILAKVRALAQRVKAEPEVQK